MKILTPEDQIKHHNVAPMPTQAASRLLGKKQALMQIHDFMDSYQKEVIIKLGPNVSASYALPAVSAPMGHYANDDSKDCSGTMPTGKQRRAELHKIWLALKPNFNPKSLL